jgi:hypothetical protein
VADLVPDVQKMFDYRQQRAADRVHAGRGTSEGNRYEWQYPLMEWGWDLERCKQAIAEAAVQRSARNVPLKNIVVSIRGRVIGPESLPVK